LSGDYDCHHHHYIAALSTVYVGIIDSTTFVVKYLHTAIIIYDE